MTTKELIDSITCLCAEGVEVLTRVELADAILGEIKKYENPIKDRCTCEIHDRVYYGCRCGGET